jgi:hypothetical protein
VREPGRQPAQRRELLELLVALGGVAHAVGHERREARAEHRHAREQRVELPAREERHARRHERATGALVRGHARVRHDAEHAALPERERRPGDVPRLALRLDGALEREAHPLRRLAGGEQGVAGGERALVAPLGDPREVGVGEVGEQRDAAQASGVDGHEASMCAPRSGVP